MRFRNEFIVWDERTEKGVEYRVIGAAIWNECKPKRRSLWGTCKLAEEEDDHIVLSIFVKRPLLVQII